MFIYTISDIISLIILAIVVICSVGYIIYTTIKQALCKHSRIFENRQCHAICAECGKDLGFIQTWREKQNERNHT